MANDSPSDLSGMYLDITVYKDGPALLHQEMTNISEWLRSEIGVAWRSRFLILPLILQLPSSRLKTARNQIKLKSGLQWEERCLFSVIPGVGVIRCGDIERKDLDTAWYARKVPCVQKCLVEIWKIRNISKTLIILEAYYHYTLRYQCSMADKSAAIKLGKPIESIWTEALSLQFVS